jgi:hypothetical protein
MNDLLQNLRLQGIRHGPRAHNVPHDPGDALPLQSREILRGRSGGEHFNRARAQGLGEDAPQKRSQSSPWTARGPLGREEAVDSRLLHEAGEEHLGAREVAGRSSFVRYPAGRGFEHDRAVGLPGRQGKRRNQAEHGQQPDEGRPGTSTFPQDEHQRRQPESDQLVRKGPAEWIARAGRERCIRRAGGIPFGRAFVRDDEVPGRAEHGGEGGFLMPTPPDVIPGDRHGAAGCGSNAL